MGTATTTKPAKTTKTKAPKAEQPKGEHGLERSHDLPWCPKKVAIFKALKALKAVHKTDAVGSKKVSEKATSKDLTISDRDVRHYCYHARAAGLVDVADVEGERGYGFYLTKKGVDTDPVKALKDQEAK